MCTGIYVGSESLRFCSSLKRLLQGWYAGFQEMVGGQHKEAQSSMENTVRMDASMVWFVSVMISWFGFATN